MPAVRAVIFQLMWLSWAAYWLLASRGAKAVERRESISSRLLHMVPLILACWLLVANHVPGSFLNTRVFGVAAWEFPVAATLTAAGLLFACWARTQIGRNWSGAVTIKEKHELITTGPYALTRHPIYTGLLLAFVGSALAVGEWRGVLAVTVAFAALWRKLLLEERWMTERFGEQYTHYKARVAALVPFTK